ncbi:diguanylate cyclase [Isoptericola sp. b490]|uniref:sensor domain-containing diguanylate cyclase n=1 Tax=Actinotalea lenta TaxID=3064654 RepID=UPI0027126123|nr:sensor domain-containing diguanylate cyclase [Isoptericola sp. b490]MDO8120246.1 diguanylate cyclase [Isoptericola sp. b490]
MPGEHPWVDPESVLASMSDAVYVVDADRHITYWNDAATRLTGYRAEEIVGTACPDGLLSHVDGDGRHLCGDRCPLQETMLDGQRREVRVFLHHRDGHLAPVHVTAAPLRDEDGRIVGAVETFRDDADFRSARRRAARLERLIRLDPLTGLSNRRDLDECLAERVARQAADGTAFSVLMIDLDRFKGVNDRYGHETGDRALVAIAETLLGAVRSDDLVARYGGEEFTVVTEVADADELEALADRLRALVHEARIDTAAGTISVTASIGVAIAQPGQTPAEVLARADRALLAAKAAGRDRTTVAGGRVTPRCAGRDAGPRAR